MGLAMKPLKPFSRVSLIAVDAIAFAVIRAGIAKVVRTQSVRANVVVPGVIDTTMVRLMDDPEAGRAWLDARVPMARLGRPEEVAKAVVACAAGELPYTAGQPIAVDGGLTLSRF